ncbi:MAG: hypothetical protein HN738_08520 [Gammaproteobacteria bacterium]|jgi:hypothetical protein|nr:hypothetical protein [Gammaproteobacteria bacterium]
MTEEEREKEKARARARAKASATASQARTPDNDAATAIAGHPIYRALQGVADLPLGAAQLVANATGIGDETMNSFMNRRDQLMQDGRSNRGSDGIDGYRLAGGIASAIPFGAVGAARGIAGRTTIGAGMGGLFGASAPVTGNPDGYWDTKADQAKVGAAFGGLAPGAVALGGGLLRGGSGIVKSFAGHVRPVFDTADESLTRMLAKVIPAANRSSSVQKLLKPRPSVSQQTPGELLVDENLPMFAQLQKYADDIDLNTKAARTAGKTDSRKALLDTIAGTDDEIAAAQAARAAKTTPLRERVIGRPQVGREGAAGHETAIEGSATANTRVAVQAQNQIDKLGAPRLTQTMQVKQGNFLGGPNPNRQNSITTAFPKAARGTAVSSVDDATVNRMNAQALKLQADADQLYQESMIGKFRTVWGGNPGRVANPRTENATAQKKFSENATDFIEDAKTIESLKKFALSEAEAVRASMKAYGIKPLTTKSVVDRMAAVRDGVETGTSAQAVLNRVMRQIQKESVDGVIDPQRLYRMRKLDLDEFVQRALGQQGSKQAQARVVKQAQGVIDDAIEEASGGGWKLYLKEFAEASKDIDRMQAGRVLKQSLYPNGKTIADPGARSAAYARGLQKLKEDGGEQLMGVGESPGGNWQKLVNLQDDLTRSADQEMLSRGQAPGSVIGEAPQIPNFLDRTVMIINNSLRGVFGVNQSRNLEKLNQVFQKDPQQGYAELARLIADIPDPTKAEEVVSKLGPEIAEKLSQFGIRSIPSGLTYGGIGVGNREEGSPRALVRAMRSANVAQ